MELTAASAKRLLRESADPKKAAFFPQFFKAGPGEYGEGDKFIGVTVPKQRAIAKHLRGMELDEVERLLQSPWHEERLTAILILVDAFQRGDVQKQARIYTFYLTNTKWINNWDIVDSSAHKIVGPFLDNKPDKLQVLKELAQSRNMWERRIAMISTAYYIGKKRQVDEAFEIAKILLHDEHDLIHKAVGWMLREVGKFVDVQLLTGFLDVYAAEMPRTMLRYAIEKLDEPTRQQYLLLGR